MKTIEGSLSISDINHSDSECVEISLRCNTSRIIFAKVKISHEEKMKAGKNIQNKAWVSVGDSVGDSVRVSVGGSVWDSVRGSVRVSIWASVGGSVREKL